MFKIYVYMIKLIPTTNVVQTQVSFNSANLARKAFLSSVSLPSTLGKRLDKKTKNNFNSIKSIWSFFELVWDINPRYYSFLNDYIMPNIATVANDDLSLLEIGPNSGKFTQLISHWFSHMTLVENDADAFNLLKKVDLRSQITKKPYTINLVNEDFTNVDFGESQFNLELLRHVIYYVPPSEWLNTMDKLYSSLFKGGSMIITYYRYAGQILDLFNKLGVSPALDFSILENDCVQHFGSENVALYSTPNTAITTCPEDMALICEIVFNDNLIKVPTKDVIATINDWYVPKRNIYSLEITDATLVITKPAH